MSYLIKNKTASVFGGSWYKILNVDYAFSNLSATLVQFTTFQKAAR